MDFSDEPYVRLYTRKTLTWKLLGWEGRAVRNAMLDGEFDAAGVFAIRGDAAECIAAVTELPLEIVRIGLERLLRTETWVVTASAVTWPTYEEAQNCMRSDRLRQRASRQARAAKAAGMSRDSVTPVTPSHAPSRAVTSSHPPSHPPSLPSTHPERESTRAHPVSPPDVPGLVVVASMPAHPGPLKASRRETAETALLGARGVARYEYTPGWKPTKAVNLARALELGLTEQDLWERWDQVQDKHYSQAFRSDEKQFNRELAWLVADKRKASFQSQSKRDREAFELPGRERRAQ